MKSALIALLTDFGTSDPYVGIMKAVINEISPSATMIDLTHQIPPGDIQQGAYYLWQASQDLPAGSVILAVVDPGVGTNRKGLYLECRGQKFIGPDNGLFSYLEYKNPSSAWELSNPDFQLQKTSRTFHGRDIFAPAAAYASNNIPGSTFGSPVENRQILPRPACFLRSDIIEGEVISVDHFGNAITSLGIFRARSNRWDYDSWINQEFTSIPNTNIKVTVQNHHLFTAATFAEIPEGKCAGIIGSTGLLEIASNGQSAADLLNINRGDKVTLAWEKGN
jgi:S-adenosylmethionine hydrolase